MPNKNNNGEGAGESVAAADETATLEKSVEASGAEQKEPATVAEPTASAAPEPVSTPESAPAAEPATAVERVPTAEPAPTPQTESAPKPIPPPFVPLRGTTEGRPSAPNPEPALSAIKNLLLRAQEKIQFRKRKKLEKILELAKQKNSITNNDVEKLLHVSDATASRYLSQLTKQGRLKRVGKPERARYEPL